MTTRKSLALFLALTFALSAIAQAPTIRSIDFYRVKRDRTEDFEAAIKDYNTTLKRAGAAHSFTMWLSLTGPAEYIRVIDYPTWADRDAHWFGISAFKDQAAELALIDHRIRDANESSRTVIVQVQPELSLPPTGEFPRMMVARWVRLHPDQSDKYMAALQNDLLPAVKKSGQKFYSVGRVWFGESRPQILSFTGLGNWSALGAPDPIAKAMGEESYRRYGSNTRPFTIDAREDVYRFLPDLSYLPAARAGK